VNAHERTASDALLDVARSWISLESPDEEVNPRELALWLASWRSEAAEALAGIDRGEGGPLSSLVDEAMAVDGNCAPLEFVEWFMDWRERAIISLAGQGRGAEIAGVPLHAALSLIVFQFEDDLDEEAIASARAAMVEIEREGFSSVGCTRARETFEGLIRSVSRLPGRPDVITRVYRDLTLETAREHLAEHRRLVGE